MLKKILSFVLSCLLTLSSCLVVFADTVTDKYAVDPILSSMDSQKLDKAKEAIIESLPDDMKNREYELSADIDGNVSLVSNVELYPNEIQTMIDDGQITEDDISVPEDVVVEVVAMDVITPYFTDDDGNVKNYISTYATINSTTYLPSWTSVPDGSYTLYVRLAYVKYTSGSKIAFRPTDLWGKYTTTSTTTISRMTMSYGYIGDKYSYPGYFNSPSTSLIQTGAINSYQTYISSPQSNYAYSRATGFSSSQCIAYSSSRAIEFNMDLYNSSGAVIAGAAPSVYF